MKKGIKILLTSIFFILLLIIIYIILVIKGIIGNPLLDTKDLVCTRLIEFENYSEETVIVFRFDKKAKLKNYETTDNLIYPTLKEAKKYYKENKKYVNSLELIEKENKVKFSSVFNQNKEDSYHFEKTKKELKEEYEKNLSFVCE